MKILATPGYLDAMKKYGTDNLLLFPPAVQALSILNKGEEPSWVIGDPTVLAPAGIPEDDGRTFKIQSAFKFYAIRDDHPKDCDCGCDGGSVTTFLLPTEY